jgi:hypothetical protein
MEVAMPDLRLNETLDFWLSAREYLATAPLEEILRREILAQLREEGHSDEDIRRAMVPPPSKDLNER